MVQAYRRGGRTLRDVAAEFGVDHKTVLRWVKRSEGRRTDRVDWSNRPPGRRIAPNRIDPVVEGQILSLRQELRESSALGEYGAQAIRRELLAHTPDGIPSVSTIVRVLERHGALDHRRRVRRPPPPRGWYLPGLEERRAELDSFDIVEDLKIASGPWVQLLTGISLHGGMTGAWPTEVMDGRHIMDSLETRWREVGLPDYVQFDNDRRFIGAERREAAIGRVARFCLSLGLSLVFVPPLERGFQADIEHFNGLWQAKVWRRFRHESFPALCSCSSRYIAASHWRHAARIESAPPRRSFPSDWSFDATAHPTGRLVLIRRTDDHGAVQLLCRRLPVDVTWVHRLVRCEIDLAAETVAFYGLRRAAPDAQPLLRTAPYPFPRRRYEP
jgi:transposase-like protein